MPGPPTPQAGDCAKTEAGLDCRNSDARHVPARDPRATVQVPFPRTAALPRATNRGAPEPIPMTKSKLNPDAAQLLSQLADGRLLSAEVNAELVAELHRDGYVRKLVSRWHVTPSGALALMESVWS